MSTDTPERTIIGPAVTFNPHALRAWMDTAYDAARDPGWSVEAQFGVNGIHPDLETDLLDVVTDVLGYLWEDGFAARDVWEPAASVRAVSMLRTTNANGELVAVIVVDLRDGVRLASLHQSYESMGGKLTGVDALVAALGTVAEQANHEVATYRRVNRLDHEVTHHTVQIDVTDVEWSNVRGYADELAAALKTNRRGLDRVAFFLGNRIGGWLLDHGRYNLAAAVQFCEDHALRYVETRETTSY